ncbi:nucleotidyl transferase AbiEii/AbiGii toxin family protein [Candidatus Gracilibacteria bacterium]|nr:nucleotidyl transferase AbiEii/AbiGii toxin family protein [Candidatus Gracilibacteria bacterium]
MIPKAEILEIAKIFSLLPNTVQKDYVISWVLKSISNNPHLSQWIFKGGTCLKKCYFETYRFSEDLDFTVPTNLTINSELINMHLEEVISWIEENSGLTFPRKDWKIEEYTNPRGNTSFQVKISYNGPLGGAPNSLPRVKFDITQDELIVDSPILRNLHHNFSDRFEPPPQILCYSINEILAEKSRALFERNGRARDVYDVVNISRNFRKEIEPQHARDIANAKFKFKSLSIPTVEQIVSAIDKDTLRANWEHQLAHQISDLPKVESFLDDLQDAIAWWLNPRIAKPNLIPIPQTRGRIAPRILFPTTNYQNKSEFRMEIIRRVAHNRQCALISYHGHERLVEPYSLRYLATGNVLLYAREIEKDGMLSNKIDNPTAYKIHEIDSASISNRTFVPQWEIEL